LLELRLQELAEAGRTGFRLGAWPPRLLTLGLSQDRLLFGRQKGLDLGQEVGANLGGVRLQLLQGLASLFSIALSVGPDLFQISLALLLVLGIDLRVLLFLFGGQLELVER